MGRTVWSTTDVPDAEATAYWADVVCDAFVPVIARPKTDGFTGRIEHLAVDGIGFSALRSSAQRVDRTRRMIARGGGDYVLVNVQLAGHGLVRQDDRVAELVPGAMTFVDSTRPYSLDFPESFAQLVVQVPRTLMPRVSTAVTLGPDGPGRLVADFFAGMRNLDPDAVASLLPHGIGLLEWAAGSAVTNDAITSERVTRFVRRHAHDPSLDAGAVAAGCGISRRTLFRALSADGQRFTELLRDVRVARAQQILRAVPSRPIAIVAQESGFAGETQLYRAFRAVTGMTPAACRGTKRQ